MAKWICPVCGYVYEGDTPPAECPVCHVPGEKFKKQEGELTLAAEHVYGIYDKTVKNNPDVSDEDKKYIFEQLKANFDAECSEVGMYLCMARIAHREGYPEIAEAFKRYAEVYPKSTTLLVDTYDVIHSGVPNAIRVAKEVLEPAGNRLRGVRIDSGDLAYLSKRVRKMLDDAGLNDCKIIVSNSLDEFTITSLLSQGAAIDSFGVGERLITAKSEPVFGAVYKIVAVGEGDKFTPRIKVSENVEKITNPGLKNVSRIYDENGHAVADMLALMDRLIEMAREGQLDHFRENVAGL